jgi:3-dehydroquinate synthetase
MRDKKNRGGEIRMALPIGLGQMHEGEGRWTVPVPESVLSWSLTRMQ